MTDGRYHHGALRKALIEKALEIIDREGIGALTIRRLARDVGVSHAAPSYHFADKGALVVAIATEGFRLLADRMAPCAQIRDPHERFRELGRAYISFAFDHPAYYRLMFGTQINIGDDMPVYIDEGDQSFGALVASVTELIARPDRSAEENERRVQAASIAAWTHVHGVVMMWGAAVHQARSGENRTDLEERINEMRDAAIDYLSATIEWFVDAPLIHPVLTPRESVHALRCVSTSREMHTPAPRATQKKGSRSSGT